MKRLGKFAVILCLCGVFLAGCGGAKVPEVVDTPSISVGKEGEITLWQIGQFDKVYYELSELADMAQREAAAYNAKQGREAAVTVEKTEPLDGGRVMVVYRFDGWESCTGFGEEELFYGTVKEAALNGYSLDVNMLNAKDRTPITTGLSQEEDKKLLITDIKANIYCDRRVISFSEGAQVNEDGSIRPSEEEELVYILVK